jgi:VanZ family protein
MNTRARWLLAPLAWTCVIAWMSTSGWSAAQTTPLLFPLFERLLPWASPEQIEALHWLTRKCAHLTEYGVLAGLWRFALVARPPARGWAAPLVLSMLTAILDEWHQATTLTRGGSPADVLLDSAGAIAVLIVLEGETRTALDRLTTALLWLAAAGGTAVIALNRAAGAASGWLWWTVPSAWIALGLWLCRRRSA